MKRPALLVVAAGLALVYCASAARQGIAMEESVVLAQDLKTLRVPGKVGAVLWTRRKDSCTLQVLVIRAPQQNAKAQSTQYPQVQAWLLRPDGTEIPFSRRFDTPAEQRSCLRCLGSEVQYSFPLSAGKDAAAAVISVDGTSYIEQLEPFKD